MDDDELFCQKLRGFTFVDDAFMCGLGIIIQFHKDVTQSEVAVVDTLCRVYAEFRAEIEFANCHPTLQ